MIAVFGAIKGEGGELLEGFSQTGKIELPEWQEGRHKGTVRWGTYQDREIILAQTGIWQKKPGRGNTQAEEVAEFVLDKFPVKIAIISATGGGMKKELETGDLVICNPVFFEGKPPLFPDPELCALAIATLREGKMRFYSKRNLTIPFYAWRRENRQEIAWKHPEVWIVEMENYFIASVATAKGVPFLAVRTVWETFNEEIVPVEERTREYQLWWDERFQRITTALRDKFLLPLLQRL